MNYRTLCPIDEKISLLGFGAMRFPVSADGTIDRETSTKMIDDAYNAGVNYFDTAYMYHDGESQSFLGQAMTKYDRESFYITNKMPIWMAETKEDVARIFEDQLSKCQVEYFDFYLLHALSAEKLQKIRDFGAYEYLAEQKAKGRIKYLGFSFHDVPELLEEICNEWKFDFAQLQLNYLDWEFQRAEEQYAILEKHNLPCIVMEPVRGGALADPGLPENVSAILKQANPDVSTASWAMRYCASLPNVLTVLSGMSTPAQLEDNLKTINEFQPLSDDEQQTVQQALRLYQKTNLLPCTKCKYCIDCPMQINIPDIFLMDNIYRINKNGNELVSNLAEVEGAQACDCISCGACVEKCPQHIDIPAELAKIAAHQAEFSK